MTSDPLPHPLVHRSPTLEDAWTRFGKYDKNATTAQKRFVFQRKLILGLGVAATSLAIIYTVLAADETAVLSQLVIPWFPSLNDFIQVHFFSVFQSLVVLVPIISTGLTAYTLKFNMGVNWVMLRSSAEALKKEIYLYRIQVGEYNPEVTVTEPRDVHLARKVKLISKRLMETQVNQTGLEAYRDKLPPLYGTADGDDGFSDLTPDQYIKWRVEDQFNYYQRKSVKFSKELQNFQIIIILLGGIGTALAALRFEVWIAISSAFATAFASFLEFKRVETTVVSCNMAAADLYDIRTWWRALPESTRSLQANLETLVHSTEQVIQSENAGWVQEMRDALSEIYGEKKEEELDEPSKPDDAGDAPSLSGIESTPAAPDVATADIPQNGQPPTPIELPPSEDNSLVSDVSQDMQPTPMPEAVLEEQPTGEAQTVQSIEPSSDEVLPEDPQDSEPSTQAVQPV